MSKERTRCREKILTYLFQKDMGQEIEVDFRDFSPYAQIFALKLWESCLKYKDFADKIISEFSYNWRIERLGIIEKNALRMAICEILCFDDIPVGVSVNEAVELTKKYVGVSASRFVNGVLRNILRNWDKVLELKTKEEYVVGKDKRT
ncbi:MAG: transcription antitermination factor NusB [Dictyoglomaceae bacterium]